MKKTKKIKKSILNFNAVFIEETDGGYSVSVPSFPGCFLQGDSFEEAQKNIKEAFSLYLEESETLPQPRREFMATVNV